MKHTMVDFIIDAADEPLPGTKIGLLSLYSTYSYNLGAIIRKSYMYVL
jgi:hypothetical protein